MIIGWVYDGSNQKEISVGFGMGQTRMTTRYP